MKQQERNLLSRKKILDSALLEFSHQGYGRSSVNTICTAGGISKGILYHYFQDKDELYLACVKQVFDELTAHLSAALSDSSETSLAQLEQYFDARLAFFHLNPLHHKLFCDVVLSPPQHLAQAIRAIKADFDALNITTLTNLLQTVQLRGDVTVAAAVETFRLYQDFVNARYQMGLESSVDLEQHEQTCKRSLTILLYGVVERGAETA